MDEIQLDLSAEDELQAIVIEEGASMGPSEDPGENPRRYVYSTNLMTFSRAQPSGCQEDSQYIELQIQSRRTISLRTGKSVRYASEYSGSTFTSFADSRAKRLNFCISSREKC
eukprot:763125-Hanusia_phi.AAC.1